MAECFGPLPRRASIGQSLPKAKRYALEMEPGARRLMKLWSPRFAPCFTISHMYGTWYQRQLVCSFLFGALEDVSGWKT